MFALSVSIESTVNIMSVLVLVQNISNTADLRSIDEEKIKTRVRHTGGKILRYSVYLLYYHSFISYI